MLKDIQDLSTPGVVKGVNTQYNILGIQKDQSPNMMNVKVNYDGSIEKRLGTNTQNAVIISNSANGGFVPDSGSTLPNGLLAYWQLNEPSGDRAYQKGTIILKDSGGVLFSGGIKNQAALFLANTYQSLYSNSATILNGATSFTIGGWFKLNSTSPLLQRTIVSKRENLVLQSGTQNITTPIMNGPTSPSGEALARTSYNANRVGWKAFDRDNTGENYWMSAHAPTATTSQWLQYTFPSGITKKINNVVIVNWGISPIASPKTFTVQGSSDGTTWSNLVQVTNDTNNNAGARRPFTLDSTSMNNFRYYRLDITDRNGTDDFVRVSDYEMYEKNINNFEYWLYVDTDNLLTFDVSSSGITSEGKVKATSIGVITTGTWYNFLAYSLVNSAIGLSVNLSKNDSAYTLGIRQGSAPFLMGAIRIGSGSSITSACFMDGIIDEVGFWNRGLIPQERADIYNAGSGNSYQLSFDNKTWACFDFGASPYRWLTVAAGTGVYASTDLGVTYTTIATSRSATYQYFDRSKNVLIMTSDAYDVPLYWSGSPGTYSVGFANSSPSCKFNINFSGYLILLNSLQSKRSFNYIDENLQLTGTGWLNFNLPSSADDEITNVFVLRRYLYVSTRYKIFRVSYVGGNPDWQYVEVKNWGFLPRTAKKIVITNNQPGVGFYYSIGEVVVGVSYDRKIRIFDGSGDQIISNNIEKDNGECDFALEKISFFGSGPVISFAEVDMNQNVYKLCVSIGQESSQTTHFLNYDGRSMALYPYDRMFFNCMCMAESANQRFLMAFDRSGYCHMMDSGNLDGNSTPINEYFDSPLLFEKTPSQTCKGHKTDFFFSNTTAGNIYYFDRIDMSNQYSLRRTFTIGGSTRKIVHYESVDSPNSYNTYQFRITSSSGTKSPWKLQRYDHFTQGMGIGINSYDQ